MRVVVIGASGNVGTAVLRALAAEPVVTSVVGVARRVPRKDGSSTVSFPHDTAEWVRVDLTGTADAVVTGLDEAMRGADAVLHLVWAIQPSHDERRLQTINVDGTRAVANAVVRNHVPQLVFMSAMSVYSPGPADGSSVDESWPTRGVPTSSYAVQKVAVERMLDRLEAEHPRLVVTRMRPALMFQRGAGSELARYFLGPLGRLGLKAAHRFAPRDAPGGLPRPLLPALPFPEGLRLQVLDADDAARAFVSAVVGRFPGAFNVAPHGALTGQDVANALAGGRLVTVPPGAARSGLALGWRARLVPVGEGWLDMARADVVLDASRARELLHWEPRRDPADVLRDTVRAVLDGSDTGSPPLAH